MKQKYAKILSLILIVSISEFSLAQSRSDGKSGGYGFYLEETFFPVYVNKNDTGSVTTTPGVATESGLGYDLRTTLGYAFWQKTLLVGLTYNMYSLQTKRGNIQGGDAGLDELTSHNQFGPTIGLLGARWRFLATLFTSGTKSVRTKNFDNSGPTGDVTIKNTGISGFQIATGYAFSISPNFQFGPTLVYRSINYSKQSKVNRLNTAENYSSVSLFSKNVDSGLSPMISLLIKF